MITFNPRQACLWIHRYTGLAMAAFLILASLTGALLAFHHELDDVFNHKLASIEAQNTPIQSVAALHDSVIRTYPQYGFSSLPTTIEAGKSAVFSVDRWRGGKPTTPEPSFNEVYVNPYTGAIIGTRDKEAWAWHNTMWKVFWLHRDLLLGNIGKWLLGIVSLVWTINCFIGFYLTFPRATKKRASMSLTKKKRASLFKRWLPAWKIRTKTNTFKLNYDVHHAFGLWLWGMLFVIAWSSVGFNLKAVYQPVMQAVVGLTPRERGRPPTKPEPNKTVENQGRADQSINSNTTVNDSRNTADAIAQAVNKSNSIAYLSAQADIAARQNGTAVQQLLGIRWVAEDEQWQMRFKTDRDIGTHSGASSITVDAATGEVARVHFGYQSGFGNKVDQWLSTLHMGHISQGWSHRLYQAFLAMIGLAVAVLSGTGVYLWWKGRQQRLKALQKGR
ncbi:MAG: PepSY domain-containing protein [Psychrobacter sp.]|uniref:PepSY-associated TM helix domain-containing protein n=1 Tax=Psychrobacter sp. TaxID=56811 RepID=UPI00264860A7|nr:PepSY-associated TM helix domain-containing protein [Psychrobacter sp.]MDN5621169.1 PepSY domain-containing protein [Psychrobacter sp.]